LELFSVRLPAFHQTIPTFLTNPNIYIRSKAFFLRFAYLALHTLSFGLHGQAKEDSRAA